MHVLSNIALEYIEENLIIHEEVDKSRKNMEENNILLSS